MLDILEKMQQETTKIKREIARSRIIRVPRLANFLNIIRPQDPPRAKILQVAKKTEPNQEAVQKNSAIEHFKAEEKAKIDQQLKYRLKNLHSREIPNEAVEKFFGNGIKLEKLRSTMEGRYFNTISLLKSFLFEPIYVSLQLFSTTQIFLLAAIQLSYTVWVLVRVVLKDVFISKITLTSALLGEVSLTVFIVIGLVFQFGGGEKNFADAPRNGLQFVAIGAVAMSAFVSFVELVILLVMTPIRHFKDRVLRKRIQALLQAREELKLVRVKKNKTGGIIHPAPKVQDLGKNIEEGLGLAKDIADTSQAPIVIAALEETQKSEAVPEKKSGLIKTKKKVTRTNLRVKNLTPEQDAGNGGQITYGIAAELARAFANDSPSMETIDPMANQMSASHRNSEQTPEGQAVEEVQAQEATAEPAPDGQRSSPKVVASEESRPAVRGIRDGEHPSAGWDLGRRAAPLAPNSTQPSAPRRSRANSKSSSSRHNGSRASLKNDRPL